MSLIWLRNWILVPPLLYQVFEETFIAVIGDFHGFGKLVYRKALGDLHIEEIDLGPRLGHFDGIFPGDCAEGVCLNEDWEWG